MQYFGGKKQIGYTIAKILHVTKEAHYIEPFCGMLGVARHVKAASYQFSDIDPAVVSLLRHTFGQTRQ